MNVELERAFCPSDIAPSVCALCERPFVTESILARGQFTDEARSCICSECVEYLGSRSESCASIETYRALLEQYPEPMWTDDEEFHRYMTAASADEQERVYASAELTEGGGTPLC